MNRHGWVRRSAGLTVVATMLVAATALAAGGSGRVTGSGVGRVHLGDSYAQLHNNHLVGRMTAGCSLEPRLRVAQLTAPLKGSVELGTRAPRKVTDVIIRGGATARGVGVGDRLANIKAAYHRVRVDHSTEAMFGVTIVTVHPRPHRPIQFAIDTHSKKITMIGVPDIPFCE